MHYAANWANPQENKQLSSSSFITEIQWEKRWCSTIVSKEHFFHNGKKFPKGKKTQKKKTTI